MDLRDSPSETRFRAELREWLGDAVAALGPAPDPEDYPARRAFDAAWQRALHDAGYAGIHWPREFGGRGATPAEHLVFLEEAARAGAPREGLGFVGLLHAGPTIIIEGTPEQRRRYLPPILRGEEVWCQGFSEPGAGSDLAALTTRAAREGDEYVVTGQKIWTSYAPVADLCELLVRTDPGAPKHKGMTWLVLPMDAPGIDVRPLRTIDGTAEFAELFLDDVRIPVANRVGAENDGWRVAMVTFAFERGTGLVGKLVDTVELLRSLTDIVTADGADRAVMHRLARLAAEFDALWALTRRNVSRATNGAMEPTAGSVFKLAFAETAQRLADLTVEVLGPRAVSRTGAVVAQAKQLLDASIYSFGYSIAAGTSQIQRDIIAERGLGLPREGR